MTFNDFLETGVWFDTCTKPLPCAIPQTHSLLMIRFGIRLLLPTIAKEIPTFQQSNMLSNIYIFSHNVMSSVTSSASTFILEPSASLKSIEISWSLLLGCHTKFSLWAEPLPWRIALTQYFIPVIAVVDDDSEEESTEAEGEAQDHEEPPPVEVTPQDPPEFDFGTEMKKFIYGILDKGEPGLPWHTLLLYLCRDASQPLAVQKAFTILGAPMYINCPWPLFSKSIIIHAIQQMDERQQELHAFHLPSSFLSFFHLALNNVVSVLVVQGSRGGGVDCRGIVVLSVSEWRARSTRGRIEGLGYPLFAGLTSPPIPIQSPPCSYPKTFGKICLTSSVYVGV